MSENEPTQEVSYLTRIERDLATWISIKLAVTEDVDLEENIENVSDINLKKLMKAELKRRRKANAIT